MTSPTERRLDDTVERTLRAARVSRRFLYIVIAGLGVLALITVVLLTYTLIHVQSLSDDNRRTLTAIRSEQAQRERQQAAGQKYAAQLLITLDQRFREDLRALLVAIRTGQPIHFPKLPSATPPSPRPTTGPSSFRSPSPVPTSHSPPPPRPTHSPRPHPSPSSNPSPSPTPHHCTLPRPLPCIPHIVRSSAI